MVTKKTRLMSGLAAIAMLISMFTAFVIPAAAEANEWDEHEVVLAGGLRDVSGLPDIVNYTAGVTEYKVTNFDGMQRLVKLVIGGTNLEGVTIYQANDIDMGWFPIIGIGGYIYTTSTSSAKDYAFSGTFDGNGFVIENLYVLRNNDQPDSVGLFGCTDGATLKNVGIASGLVVGTKKVGALVGKSVNTSIINCWNAATVIGGSTQGVGGIAGYAEGDATVFANCYNLGLVFNHHKNAAGIVGNMTNAPDAAIVNCYNAGEIVTGMNGYGDAKAVGNLEAYQVIMGADYTAEVASGNANNYYINNGSKVISVAELIERDGGVFGDGSTEIMATDAATGMEVADLANGRLAAALNTGDLSIGAEEGYTIAFEDTGAGYPAIAYRQYGMTAVKRVAHSTDNVVRNTWAEKSAIFKTVSDNRNGGWASGASNKLNDLELGGETAANDLFVLGLLSSFESFASIFGNGNVTLTSDINMDDMDLCPATYYVPLASGSATSVNYTGTFDGANHVIFNWRYYATQSGGNVNGGLITKAGAATIKNLGMINAYGDYDYFINGGYAYPALMVEREYASTGFYMDNCFVIGTLDIESSAQNANNNGGVFSTTWGANDVNITNCWALVNVINPASPNAAPTQARVIGKIPGATTTCPSFNNYFLAEKKPTIANETTDNGANRFQTMLTGYSVADGTMAAFLNDVTSQTWASKNGYTTFVTSAADATYLVEAVKMMGNYAQETVRYAYGYGETVTTPDFTAEGYVLDTSKPLPNGAAEGSFKMPAKTVTLYYKTSTPDYTILEDLLAQYEDIDSFYIVDGEGLTSVLNLARDVLDSKDTLSDAEAIDYISMVMESYEALDLSMRTDYPNLPAFKDYDIYAALNTTNTWLITDPEDWRTLVFKANRHNSFSGHNFHFTADLDMNNEAVDPINPNNQQAFRGKIYGHGHVFKNLLIDWAVTKGDGVALIGYAASGCRIEDLGIESGLIRAYGSSSGELMLGSFVGQGDDTILLNCWNAATVDGLSDDNTGGQSVSGIARLRNSSVVDGCYNIGAVKGNGFVGTLSGYTQSATVVWNSFAVGTSIGGTKTFLRYTGTVDTLGLAVNSYTVDNAGYYDSGNSEYNATSAVGGGVYNTAKYELTSADYTSGKLAWLLNSNYDTHKDYDKIRTYFTVNDAGHTVHGTEANQTVKIGYLVGGVEVGASYVNAGTEYTLSFAPGATYALAEEGVAELNGNVLTVPAADINVNVVVGDGLDYAELVKALAKYSGNAVSYMKNSAELQALIDAVTAKIAAGTYEDQGAIDADVQALTDAYVFAGYPNLPSIKEINAYPDAPGYMINSLADLEYLATVKRILTVDDVIYFGADIEVTDKDSVANDMTGLKASIDGKGHTLKGITISGTDSASTYGGWLDSYAGNYVKNLTMDSWSGSDLGWQGALLMSSNANTSLELENIKAINCSASTIGANGLSILVGINNGDRSISFKNIHIEGCTMDRKSNSGNSGFLLGRLENGTLTAENIYLINNKLEGNLSAGGRGVLIGEVTGNATIKNVGIFNTTYGASASASGILAGVFKKADGSTGANPTLNVENVISSNCGNYPFIFRSGTANTINAKNLYASVLNGVSGTEMTDDEIASGAAAYAANSNGASLKWEMVDGLPVFDTDGKGATVKVSFVDRDGEPVADLYTDVNGKLIGLTEEFFGTAEWEGYEYFEKLETAVFTADAVINEVACDHNLVYVANGDGKNHTVTCTTEGGCGKTQVVACELEYTPLGNVPGTHSVKCELCGYEVASEACKTTTAWADATCLENKQLRKTCDLCGVYEVLSEEEGTSLGGHDWKYTHVEGTEGVDATHTAVCKRDGCDATEAAAACSFKDTYVEHTTGAKGYTRYTCEDCGYFYDVKDATVTHTWDEENGVVAKYPTFETPGSLAVDCKFCDASAYIDIPVLSGTGIEVIAPEDVDANEQFTAQLKLGDNTGIFGMTVKVTYDAETLTLNEVENGDLFANIVHEEVTNITDGVLYLSVVSYEGSGDVTVDGLIATLTFSVKEGVLKGKTTINAEVSKSPDAPEDYPDTGAATYDMQPVAVKSGAALVEIGKAVWGDANSDTITDMADVILIMRYVIKMVSGNELDLEAADTQKNNMVTLGDAVLIMRYLAGSYNPFA